MPAHAGDLERRVAVLARRVPGELIAVLVAAHDEVTDGVHRRAVLQEELRAWRGVRSAPNGMRAGSCALEYSCKRAGVGPTPGPTRRLDSHLDGVGVALGRRRPERGVA